MSASATYLDAKLTSDYCGTFVPHTLTLNTSCPNQVNTFVDHTTTTGPLASSGDSLPVAPKLKANTIVRYAFSLGDWEANVQGAYVYQGASSTLLRSVDKQHLGENPAFSMFDLSGGIERNRMSFQLVLTNVFDERAQITRFGQCTPTTCTQTYIVPTQPRTIGLRFGQKF